MVARSSIADRGVVHGVLAQHAVEDRGEGGVAGEVCGGWWDG